MNATVLTALLLLSSGAESTELTPEKVSQIHAEQAKAHAAIDKKYGDKKLSELTSDERRDREKERRAASLHVLEQSGTDDKTFSRYEATLSREERTAVKTAEDKLKTSAEQPQEPEIIDGVEDGPEIEGATKQPSPPPNKETKRPRRRRNAARERGRGSGRN